MVVPSGRIPGAGDPGEQPFRLLGEFTLRRRNQDLSVNALQEIGDCLAMGGLCIAPSDSGFALVANPFVRNTTTIIDTILERKQEKVPLSFASLPMIERYAELSPIDFRLIGALMPGPLTVVVPLLEGSFTAASLSSALFTESTVGCRLSGSGVERQLSAHAELPLTTVAIRNPDGSIVKDFDKAVSVVAAGAAHLDRPPPTIGVRSPEIRTGDHSTVVMRSPFPSPERLITEIRPGAIELRRCERAVAHLSYREIRDWT